MKRMYTTTNKAYPHQTTDELKSSPFSSRGGAIDKTDKKHNDAIIKFPRLKHFPAS